MYVRKNSLDRDDVEVFDGSAMAPQFLPPLETVPFDQAALAWYLGAVGLRYDPQAPIFQFGGGFANRNYLLEVDGQPTVLRRPPDGVLPRGAHDMSREHRILRALSRVLEIVPDSLHLCADDQVIGAPFQLIEFRPGLVARGATPPVARSPEACAALSGRMVQTLALIHSVDADACGLGDLGRPEDFVGRTIAGWLRRGRTVAEAPASAASLVEEIAAWLSMQHFAPRAPTLLHSDFKLDNLILDPASLEVRAVIDWDMGTRGDPLFDLATLLSYWSEPGDPPALRRFAMMPTAATGFGSRSEAAARYSNFTALDLRDLPALHVLALMKLGVVLLQLHARWRMGAVKSDRYAKFGEHAIEVLVHARDLASKRAL